MVGSSQTLESLVRWQNELSKTRGGRFRWGPDTGVCPVQAGFDLCRPDGHHSGRSSLLPPQTEPGQKRAPRPVSWLPLSPLSRQVFRIGLGSYFTSVTACLRPVSPRRPPLEGVE